MIHKLHSKKKKKKKKKKTIQVSFFFPPELDIRGSHNVTWDESAAAWQLNNSTCPQVRDISVSNT